MAERLVGSDLHRSRLAQAAVDANLVTAAVSHVYLEFFQTFFVGNVIEHESFESSLKCCDFQFVAIVTQLFFPCTVTHKTWYEHV